MTTRRCTNCGQEKPLDDFHRMKKGKHGRASICKECKLGKIRQGPPKEELQCEVSDDAQIVTAISSTIKTLDEAIVAAKVDTAIWEVERYIVNKWDMGAKLGKDETERLAVVPLWQVKVWLRRKVPKMLEDATAGLIERMQKHSPDYKPIPRIRRPDPHLLEVSVFDAHFGKLAWSRETGNNYDLRIAEKLYKNAVEELAGRVAGFNIDQIVFPVGSDFFHIDNRQNATANGTPQDVDGRFTKIFVVGEMAVIHAIDLLRKIAPVKVIWVPGNHDRTTSWYLVHCLAAHYRRDKEVTVDDEPKWRKRVRYGNSLIGFTHGNEEAHRDLPTIMASEWPEDWAATTFREWHVGHLHKKKETHYLAGDTFGGVVVKTLPSISGTDQWHYSRGYVKARRAAECYLWSKANGPVGNFSANVPDAA